MALACGLFFYALSDVLLWQRIFEAHDMWEFQRQYDSGHVTTMVALIGVGVVLLWDTGIYALWYAGAFYTLAFGGVCDVLYYWIDERSVPGSMPWLNADPFILFKPAGGWSLVASAVVWILVWSAALGAFPVAQRLLKLARAKHRDVIGEADDHCGAEESSSSARPQQQP